MAELAQENGWTLGAEIGVLHGKTLFHLMDNVPGLSMIAVDHWHGSDYAEKELSDAREGFFVASVRHAGRLTVLEGDSVAMAGRVMDGSLDFVFIDAEHTEEAVLADINAWMPKVKTVGGVLGHDIDWESVKAAVEKVGRYDILPDDVWRLKS